uniref:Uncharacterized protein n=1 Tax=Opuntia streptacantha TaxID=393608 RepID=A0A7C9A5N3_OPUST
MSFCIQQLHRQKKKKVQMGLYQKQREIKSNLHVITQRGNGSEITGILCTMVLIVAQLRMVKIAWAMEGLTRVTSVGGGSQETAIFPGSTLNHFCRFSRENT